MTYDVYVSVQIEFFRITRYRSLQSTFVRLTSLVDISTHDRPACRMVDKKADSAGVHLRLVRGAVGFAFLILPKKSLGIETAFRVVG